MVYAHSRTPLNEHLVITNSLFCPRGRALPYIFSLNSTRLIRTLSMPSPPLSVPLTEFDCISNFDDRVESFQFRVYLTCGFV